MCNTIQLYTDENNEVKGYPITTPDRVLDENGKSVKEKMKNNVKFNVVGKGNTVPPINGGNADLSGEINKIKGHIETANGRIDNINNRVDNVNERFEVVKAKVDKIEQEDTPVEIPIVGNTLTLTTNKRQKTNMVNNTTIVLPVVNKFTEIHLFFNTTEEITLTLPRIKWQGDINIEANKTYEFIFTYINNSWLGGCVSYNEQEVINE